MTGQIKKKAYLTYPTELVKEALICEMYDAIGVRFNIRNASVSDAIGIIALELSGTETNIEKAFEFFRSHGVKVDPIEQNIIEG